MGVLQGIQRVLRRQLNVERRQYYVLQHRLRHMERYQKTSVDMLGYHVHLADAASFLSSYRLIFIGQVYRFSPGTPSPFILDCGANVGLSVLYFKRLYQEAQIIAFEPDIEISNVLGRNVADNRLSQVDIVKSAVWTQNGTLDFLPDHADAGQVVQASGDQTIKVPCVRLRDYLTHPIDLLKLDIEGAEVDVLFDCADYLRQARLIILEYHSYAERPQRLDDLLRLLKEQGFRCYIGLEQTPFNRSLSISTYQGIDQGLLVYAIPQDKIRYQCGDI